MCGSRKYPHPHHGGNWKFWRNSEQEEFVSEITFPDGQVQCCDDLVQKSLLTYFVDILHRINNILGNCVTVPVKCKLTVSTRNSILETRCFRESRIEFRGSSFEFRESRIENRVSRIEFRVSRHLKKFSRHSIRDFAETI